MAFEKRPPRWRQHLTEEEARVIAEIDAQEEALRFRITERAMIANRAAQRARYTSKAELTA